MVFLILILVIYYLIVIGITIYRYNAPSRDFSERLGYTYRTSAVPHEEAQAFRIKWVKEMRKYYFPFYYFIYPITVVFKK